MTKMDTPCRNPVVKSHRTICLQRLFFAVVLALSFSVLKVRGADNGSGTTQSLKDFVQKNPPLDDSLLKKAGRNLRWSLDLSLRGAIDSRTEEVATQQVAGLDLHKVFSSPERDWATLVLQLYLTRINNQERHPPFFESSDDWELIPRVVTLNFSGLSNGGLNLRVGHIELPYGLEVPIASNGTIRQLTLGPNLGLKVDWGVGLNGNFEKFRYEVALTRGSGVEYHSSGSPFAITGRIGTPTDIDSILGAPGFGVSGFYGDVLGRSGITQRSRLGLDALWQIGSYGVMAELSVGRDGDRDVVNAFTELNWQNRDETWMLYAQNKLFNKRFLTGWDDTWSAVVGLRFAPDNHWAWSAQFEQQISVPTARHRSSFFTLQARYRF